MLESPGFLCKILDNYSFKALNAEQEEWWIDTMFMCVVDGDSTRKNIKYVEKQTVDIAVESKLQQERGKREEKNELDKDREMYWGVSENTGAIPGEMMEIGCIVDINK